MLLALSPPPSSSGSGLPASPRPNLADSLERHVFPRIGSRPISEMTSPDVLEILTPIWPVNVQTGRRLRETGT